MSETETGASMPWEHAVYPCSNFEKQQHTRRPLAREKVSR